MGGGDTEKPIEGNNFTLPAHTLLIFIGGSQKVAVKESYSSPTR